MKKIIGLGSPIIDEIAFVDDVFLESVSGSKGGMELLGESELELIKSDIDQELVQITGGSAGNTIFALARLGIQTSFIGKIGNCPSGDLYKKSLAQYGGNTQSFKIGNIPNGKCLSLVTPDGERTMRTSLGAAMTLTEDELTPSDFEAYDHLHIEGFVILNKNVLLKALDLAKYYKLTVSFDLASFEIVNQTKGELVEILRNNVDIVFANEDEAAAFTQLPASQSEESVKILNELCETAVVKLGAKGSLIAQANTVIHSEAIPVKRVIDTTGAGDFWAAGFLHGWANNHSIEHSARLGALMGATVIQNHGGTLSHSQWDDIMKSIQTT
jgi:sugar/nucleoside kinase (ribokinase family)